MDESHQEMSGSYFILKQKEKCNIIFHKEPETYFKSQPKHFLFNAKHLNIVV